MQLSHSTYKVSNEEDAIELLKAYDKGEYASDTLVDLEFDGWPSLNVRLVGDKYKGTITPTVMVGFLELQKEVYRTFAYAKYGTFNTNKLTQKERDDLELKVSVKDGSSKFNIDFQGILTSFMENSVSKLTGKQIVFITISLGLLFTGHTTYKSYLEDRKDMRASELATLKENNSNKEKKELVEAMKFMSEKESERFEVMAKLIESEPQSANIKSHAENAHTELIKSFKKADEVEIAGVLLDNEEIKELIKNSKKEFKEIRLDGTYRILNVDSSTPDVFKVKIINIHNERKFTTIVRDETFRNEYKTIIKNAEWSKKRVDLSITAQEFNDEIKYAVIIKAKEYKVI